LKLADNKFLPKIFLASGFLKVDNTVGSHLCPEGGWRYNFKGQLRLSLAFELLQAK